MPTLGLVGFEFEFFLPLAAEFPHLRLCIRLPDENEPALAREY